MKIIDKRKDYYDYLTGIYGIDDLVVYDRREPEVITFEQYTFYTKIHTYYIAICGELYFVMYDKPNNKFYFNGEAYSKLNPKYKNYYTYYKNQAPVFTDINDKLKCPVVLDEKHKNILLKDFGINRIVSPEDMFFKISNWLSKDKVIPDTQSNENKIVSAGFDLKTSFRNIK